MQVLQTLPIKFKVEVKGLSISLICDICKRLNVMGVEDRVTNALSKMGNEPRPNIDFIYVIDKIMCITPTVDMELSEMNTKLSFPTFEFKCIGNATFFEHKYKNMFIDTTYSFDPSNLVRHLQDNGYVALFEFPRFWPSGNVKTCIITHESGHMQYHHQGWDKPAYPEMRLDPESGIFVPVASGKSINNIVHKEVSDIEFKYETWMGKTPRANAIWEPEEETKLWEHYEKKLSINQIAKIHGRNIQSIANGIERLKAKREDLPEMIAGKITTSGYRIISRKFRTVARIDTKYWLRQLSEKMGLAVADFYKPDGQVSTHWADYYRRTISQDKLSIQDDRIFNLLESSGNDNIGHVDNITTQHIQKKFRFTS